MMKGPRISAMAIRQQNGEIITETWDSGGNKWYHKVPILRGIFNFIGMLGQGYTVSYTHLTLPTTSRV